MKRFMSYLKGFYFSLFNISVLSVLDAATSIGMALVMKEVVDFAIGGQWSKAVAYCALLGLILFIQMTLSALLTLSIQVTTEKMRAKLQYQLLTDIFDKMWLSLMPYSSGDLSNRLYQDISSLVTAAVSTIPKLLALTFQLAIAYYLLSVYDGWLAALAVLIMPATIGVSYILGRSLKKIQLQLGHLEGQQRSLVNEALHNLLLIKAHNLYSEQLKAFAKMQGQLLKLTVHKSRLVVNSNMAMGLGYRLGFLCAIFFGALRLHEGAISLGMFTAFIQLVSQIQGPIQGFAQGLPQLISCTASVERIEGIRDLPSEGSEYVQGNATLETIFQKLMIRDVIAYYEMDKRVLDGVNLDLHKGEKIGLLGASGAGKTTLVHLLLALFKPQQGHISVEFKDGTCQEVSIDSRILFSYVPQTSVLFSGTIAENLKSDRIEAKALTCALETACCQDFIKDLPLGLDQVLGENGFGLSQGQLQRLAIARALSRDAQILILDEATSALDGETEGRIIANLKANYPELTLIAITHRPGILNICDAAYTIREGKITAYDNPQLVPQDQAHAVS